MKKGFLLMVMFLSISAAAFGQSVVSDVWFESSTPHPAAGEYFLLDVYVNAGDDDVMLFNADFSFDDAQLKLDSKYYEKGVYCPMSSQGTLVVYGITTEQFSVLAIEPAGFPGSTSTYLMTFRFKANVSDPGLPGINVVDLRNTDDETILPDNLVFEKGRLNVDQSSSSQWRTVTLQNTYTDPIVIMGTPSFNESDPMVMRVRNVTGTSFQYQLDEWNYLDGSHSTESFGYMVFEKGAYRVNGIAIVAGTITNVTDVWKTGFINARAYDGTQVILTQVVTTNESTAVTTRLRNINDLSFQVRVQEEAGENGTHNPETVHFLAIERKLGNINGIPVLSKNITKVTHAWTYIDVSSIPDPLVFGQILTYNGSDPAALRYDPLSSTLIEIKAEEEQSADSEVSHTKETVGILLIEE